MLKVRNNLTGQIEDIPENQVAEAITSGQYSLQKGIKIPVVSPDGKPGTVDSSEAFTAFQSGFSYETREQQEAREKQERLGDMPVTAGALGTARTLSFGLSDQALSQSGLVEPETLKDIKELNPEASIVGETAGILGPALVTGGSSLLARGATSAVRGASAAGVATERAVAKALAKRLVTQGEQTLAKKVLTKVGAKAAGSAVEGAFYGAGHLISEDALGNTELNAESLLANMGVGALIGGAAGSAFGIGELATLGVIKAGQKVSEQAKPLFRRLIGAKDLPEETGILASLTQKKANVEDLRTRANRLEVELTTGAESANQRVRDAESILNETPSIFGQQVQKVAEDNRLKLQTNTARVFSEASQKTEREVGKQVIDDIKDQLQKRYDPFNVAYDEIRKHTPYIELEQIGLQRTANNISKLGGEIGSKGGDIAKFTEQEASRISLQKTVDDLANYISELKSKARGLRITDPKMAYAAEEVARKAESLRKRTILREADRLAKSGAPEAKLAGEELLANIRTTNRQYREFKQFLSALGEEGRLGKSGTFSQVIDRLDSLDPETVAKRFFDPKRLDAVLFMQKNFPKQFEELRALKLAQIAEEVTQRNPTYGIQYNLGALERQWDKLGKTPEFRQILFGKKGSQTIEDIIEINKAIPGVSNPSRTDIRRDFERLLTPVLWVRDAALLGVLSGAKGSSREVATIKGVESLAQVERSQKKITKSIQTSIDRFLRGQERVKQKAPAVTTNAILDVSFSEKKSRENKVEVAFQKRSDEISRYIANPSLLTDRLTQNTSILGTVAPKTATALQMKAINAINFIHLKMPSNPAVDRTNNLMIRKWKPSTVELRKFERYMRALENPMDVIGDLEKGIINREGIETLKNVYPEIYSQVVSETMGRLSELQTELPYSKRLLLGNLLGVPLELAMEPNYVAALQGQFQPKAEQPQPTSGNLGKLDIASQMETETQRITGRS